MSGKYIERNVIDPKRIVQVYRNYWWWCRDGDPTRAIFYQRSARDVGAPQCNVSKQLAEHVGESLDYGENARLVQIPLAFAPWESE